MSFIQSKLINLNGNVTGTLSPSHGGAGPVTKSLFVDGNRTDSYTATGAINLPFKTIGAAISQIITNADNATHPYCVYVYEGSYNETLSFNNALLYNIAFVAMAYNQGQINSCVFGQGSGTAITSTSNNTNLGSLSFSGFTINGDIIMTGDINNTNFGSSAIVFVGCNIQKDASGILITNLNNIYFYFSAFNSTGTGPLTFHNVAFALLEDGDGIKAGITLNLQDNPAGNVPSQYAGNYFLMERSTLSPTLNCDAGSELDTVGGYMGGGTVTMNGIWHAYGTIIASPVVLNNGSSFRNRGSSYSNTFTVNAGATVTNQGHYLYTPATSGNWNSVPTVVDGGLDTLASSGVVKSQSQNLVLASPNGSSGVPSFRAIVNADLPTVSVAHGGTGVTSVTTSPTATAWAGWDANSNLSANNFLAGYRTTATAAGTTTLTVSDAWQQYFTGSTTQTCQLPVVSTLVLGFSYQVVNLSSGVVTVTSSGGNTIKAMAANSIATYTVISTSGTGAASWSFAYNTLAGGGGGVTSVDVSGGTTGLTTSGGPITSSGTITLAGTLAIANGGTGQTSASSAFNALSPITTTGDIIYSSSGTTNARLAIGATNTVLQSSGTVPQWGPVVTSSTYTPTFTTNNSGVVTSGNITLLTNSLFQYMRIGSVVTVGGMVNCNASSAGTADFQISLPVASTFNGSGDCSGTACASSNLSTIRSPSGYINADTTNHTARVAATIGNTGAEVVSLTFVYVIK